MIGQYEGGSIKFHGGDESLEDDEGRGRACSLDNKKLQTAVEQNFSKSLREMFQTLALVLQQFHAIYRALEKVKNLNK